MNYEVSFAGLNAGPRSMMPSAPIRIDKASANAGTEAPSRAVKSYLQ